MTPQDAIRLFGTQAAMARAFGVTEPAVLRWRKLGKFPPLRVYELPAAIERHKAAQKSSETALEVVERV